MPDGPTFTGAFFDATDPAWKIYSSLSATRPALMEHVFTNGILEGLEMEFSNQEVKAGKRFAIHLKCGGTRVFSLYFEGGGIGNYQYSDGSASDRDTGVGFAQDTFLTFTYTRTGEGTYTAALNGTSFSGNVSNLPIDRLEIENDAQQAAGSVAVRNLSVTTLERPSTLSASVKSWRSNGFDRTILTEQANAGFLAGEGTNPNRICVNPGEQHQPIVGFGSSMTEASSSLIYNSPHRDEIMTQLFHPERGIGLSLIRIPIGASDFSTASWSYEDVPGKFSLGNDLDATIPLLKQALEINPDIRLTAVPWSAPGWMKTTGQMEGGELLPEYLDEYAGYFVKFIQAYQAHGLPIWAVSPQNEPGHQTSLYPSMRMTAAQQIELIGKMALQFASHGLGTEIICWDHNYNEGNNEGEAFVTAVYADPTAYATVLGSAWHQYGGEASVMGKIASHYPDKGVYLTERTGEKGSFWGNYNYFLRDVFYPALRNDARTLATWNIAVDENGGPTMRTDWTDAAGLIEYHSGTQSYELWGEYAALGHYAKFVQPGAVRLGLANHVSPTHFPVTAFKNPDGTIAIILYNQTGSEVGFDICLGGRHLPRTLADGDAMTCLFHELDDIDENLLSDQWERHHFGQVPVNPAADPDSDGRSNAFEHATGSDPSDSSDYLRLRFGSNGPHELRATSAHVNNFRKWTLQQSNDLRSWNDLFLEDRSSGSQEKLFSLPPFEELQSFYRLRVENP